MWSFQGGMVYGDDETKRPYGKYALIISKPSKVQANGETQIHILHENETCCLGAKSKIMKIMEISKVLIL